MERRSGSPSWSLSWSLSPMRRPARPCVCVHSGRRSQTCVRGGARPCAWQANLEVAGRHDLGEMAALSETAHRRPRPRPPLLVPLLVEQPEEGLAAVRARAQLVHVLDARGQLQDAGAPVEQAGEHRRGRLVTVGAMAAAERASLRPLPSAPFDPTGPLRVKVDRKARIAVRATDYSPTELVARIRAARAARTARARPPLRARGPDRRLRRPRGVAGRTPAGTDRHGVPHAARTLRACRGGADPRSPAAAHLGPGALRRPATDAHRPPDPSPQARR